MKKSVKATWKSIFNFAVNASMTLCMSAIIGILIRYTLISGQDCWDVYGRNMETYLFGMDRCQWRMVQLIMGFVLLGLLVARIVLHWKVVTSVYQKIIKVPLGKKIVATCFVII